ncbi:hypothetical protein LCGC14_0111610 [marine sediment metagenome]|uniref:Uncharacterized protein n=2 Tax=root TaxID=1 RepID=A0A7V1FLX2_9RHOB|nr:hypothetical protein [Sulfitobacter litoralis]HDZ51555.1 hypothetical protein [Sulfitobacter litoralis]
MALKKDGWTHTASDHRIENIAAFDAEISKDLAQLALRFISEKGLSNDFADALEEVLASADAERTSANETPEP